MDMERSRLPLLLRILVIQSLAWCMGHMTVSANLHWANCEVDGKETMEVAVLVQTNSGTVDVFYRCSKSKINYSNRQLREGLVPKTTVTLPPHSDMLSRYLLT